MVIIPLYWVLYFGAARDLYKQVFTKYPGIAFAGRSSLWIAAAAVPVGVLLSCSLSPGGWRTSLEMDTVLLLDRSVLFGIAFFLLLLVLVMVRYPISIQRNIAVHCFFFSGILFVQTLSQVWDQWTSYKYTASCNVLAAAGDATLALLWAIALTKQGDNSVIRVRHNIRPETEIHLLGQLDALNGILLRAARK